MTRPYIWMLVYFLTACAVQSTPSLPTALDPAAVVTQATVATPPVQLADPLNTDQGFRILALGDSYTIGEGVLPAERFPVQLAERLRAAGLTVADPTIIARTGWTTADLSAALDAVELSPPYDLVTLLIGVNNQYRGLSAEAYQDEFARLLERAISYAGGEAGRVMVLSIPDWSVTPFGAGRDRPMIATQIDTFNAINRQVSANLGARYFDITPISRQAGNQPDLIAADGLHPSGKMYARWVELILPLIER